MTVEDGAVGRDTAMARVMVVGCAGSGKSEASRRLARITGLPLIHLDAHFWKPGWTQPDRGDWEQTVDDLAAQPRWIMDGNYSRTLSRRLARADTLIHLDFSTLLCTWRVLKRTWGLGGARANELPAGCSERFDWSFLWYVITYRRRQRSQDMARMASFTGTVYRFSRPRQLEAFLSRVALDH